MPTPLEQLTDLHVQQNAGVTLAEWLAYYRQPGENWMNWEQISRLLFQTTDRWVHRPSIRTWAERIGIPDTKTPGKRGTVEDTLNYRKQINALGIRVPLDEPTRKVSPR